MYQIFLIRTGTGLFRDLESGTEIILEPGMAFAFPPDRGHEYYPTSHEPWHVGFIGFQGSQAHGLLEALELLPSVPYRTDRFEQCWEEIGQIWHTVNSPAPNRQDEMWMQELSITLYRLLLMLRPAKRSEGSGNRLAFESVRNEAPNYSRRADQRTLHRTASDLQSCSSSRVLCAAFPAFIRAGIWGHSA